MRRSLKTRPIKLETSAPIPARENSEDRKQEEVNKIKGFLKGKQCFLWVSFLKYRKKNRTTYQIDKNISRDNKGKFGDDNKAILEFKNNLKNKKTRKLFLKLTKL